MRFSPIKAIALGAICYVAVPHPYCYSLDHKKETSAELRLFYKKIDFFRDCDKVTRSIVNTEKNIIIYFDGIEKETMRTKEICEEHPQ